MNALKRSDMRCSFDGALDAAFPWDNGTIVVLRAYFDASARTTGVYCVAGVAFGLDRAKKAERAWRELFGARRCHMTDLHARKGAFAGIDAADADRLCRGAVRIINDYASMVVAVSCDVDEVKRLTPTAAEPHAEGLLDTVRSPYNCGLHWTMMAMGELAGRQQQIQYWFELGDENQGAARRYLAGLNEPMIEPLRKSYCYGSDAFVSKKDAQLFDAADLVAWEWGTHVNRLRAGAGVRPSIKALMKGPCVLNGRPFCASASRYANHYSGQPLETFFQKIGRIMRATSQDEIDAVVAESQ